MVDVKTATDIFLWGFSWWLVPLIVIFVYKKKLSKYPIGVTIYEKRGNDIIVTNDVAGRFVDPINEYRLKNSKDTMPIPDYDWVNQYMYKPTNLFEKAANLLSGKIGHLTLFKYGSKQYKPVKVKMKDGSFKTVYKPILNEQGQEIYIKIYEAMNPKLAMTKLEFEVIDWDDANHYAQELRAIALRRSPILKFLERYGGWIAMVLGIMMLIFAGYYYQNIITDAGNKAASLINDANPNKAPPAEVVPASETHPNIPLIGDLVS